MGVALNVRHPLDLMAGIQCEVNARYPTIWDIRGYGLSQVWVTLAKINISYFILFNLTTSYSSYFGGKKGISRNKTSFFLLMQTRSQHDIDNKYYMYQLGVYES